MKCDRRGGTNTLCLGMVLFCWIGCSGMLVAQELERDAAVFYDNVPTAVGAPITAATAPTAGGGPMTVDNVPTAVGGPMTVDHGIGDRLFVNSDGSADSSLWSQDLLWSHDVGYDNGIFLRLQKDDDSFELKTNIRTQFRVVSFSRNEETWTDNAGTVRPIENRQDFDIERLRVVLSGHAFTPQFKYFVQMDGDTDSRHVVSILDGWVAWHFSDAFEMQFGKRKVPGTRNWMLGAFDTRLADRPFSNEFFRPSRTTGIWCVGDPTEATHYELMLGQGYNTEGLTPSETNNNFAAAGTAWWDVIGKYGPGRPSDFEFHDDLAVRIGSSWVSSNEGTPGRALEEADFLRLTDGTRVTETGALAPGATVESFDVALLAIDAAFKYQGWSANAEYFWRSVTNLKSDLPVSHVGLQHGFYVEGGFFVFPQQLELNSQVAYVTGQFGSTTSYATGFSYYPRKAPYLKLTLDATFIDGSPANSTGSDILVGDNGVLIRFQWQALF